MSVVTVTEHRAAPAFDDFYRDEYHRLVPMIAALLGDRAGVIARYDDRSPGDGRDPVVESFDELGLVVVELTLLDDSTTQARYAVWYRTTDSGELRVERAYRIYVCGRGIAAPDMCV